jgi:hypothetical protein
MDICLAGARAAASRRNGAKSCGPKTSQGKARSARNALKHGLRAEKFVLLGDEDAAAFAALEDALIEELAPAGALQGLLARRLVVAAWRLERADRIESELFAKQGEGDVRGWGRLGLALVRDGNGPRAFDTLLRYRGSAMAELWRALRALKALQAEAARLQEMREAEPDMLPGPQPDAGAGSDVVATPAASALAQEKRPIEPEARGNPAEIASPPPAGEPEKHPARPDTPSLAAEHARFPPANPDDARRHVGGP